MSRAMDAAAAAFRVWCPRCCAPPRARCEGAFLGLLHRERIRAARRLIRLEKDRRRTS